MSCNCNSFSREYKKQALAERERITSERPKVKIIKKKNTNENK